MRYWDDLRESTTNFVQMPFQILESSISPEAKVLYMHLWKEAFTNQRWYKGNMYAEMSYKDIAKHLHCNRNYAVQYSKELLNHNFVEKKHGKSKNKWFFIKQRYWR